MVIDAPPRGPFVGNESDTGPDAWDIVGDGTLLVIVMLKLVEGRVVADGTERSVEIGTVPLFSVLKVNCLEYVVREVDDDIDDGFDNVAGEPGSTPKAGTLPT